MTTRLAISIPQTFPSGHADPGLIRRYLERAEALGCFEGVWDQEQILGTQPNLEPLHLLTYAAACTRRLRLGCAVVVSALRSPVHLAKELGTIDQLSEGRLDVGVGLGAQTGSYAAFAADPSTRVSRFIEGIRVMKALWTEPRTSFEGRFWQLENAAMEPKPIQKPHPPLWFGGNHPNALRRAAKLGDAFMGAGSASTAAFAQQVQTLHELLREEGRDPAAFPIGKRVYFAVDRDRDRAWQGASAWFQARYGRTNFQDIAVWGTPDECVERLRQVAAAGAQTIMFTPLYDEPEQMERIAADIAPRLAGSQG